MQHDHIAQTYFDRFVAAFGTFDPARIADLFAIPGVTLRADGSLVALTTRDDVIRYYRSATEGYHHKDCRSGRIPIDLIGGPGRTRTCNQTVMSGRL